MSRQLSKSHRSPFRVTKCLQIYPTPPPYLMDYFKMILHPKKNNIRQLIFEPYFKQYSSNVSISLVTHVGDTVHLMSVTSTPFGANLPSSPSFVCLLSQPDTGELNNINTGRHVLSGIVPPYDSPDLPLSTRQSMGNSLTTYLLTSTFDSQGVFFCESFNRGLSTRVTVTILINNSK